MDAIPQYGNNFFCLGRKKKKILICFFIHFRDQEDQLSRLPEDLEEELAEQQLIRDVSDIQCSGGPGEWGIYDGDGERLCVQNEINMTCRRGLPR
jgi:hypothetical protein